MLDSHDSHWLAHDVPGVGRPVVPTTLAKGEMMWVEETRPESNVTRLTFCDDAEHWGDVRSPNLKIRLRKGVGEYEGRQFSDLRTHSDISCCRKVVILEWQCAAPRCASRTKCGCCGYP